MYQLPAIFSRFSRFGQPAAVAPTDTRHVADVLAYPNFQFYNPDALNFPDTMIPNVPGAGGYVTLGLGQVENPVATWDRCDLSAAGPVREFFKRDTRIKHV